MHFSKTLICTLQHLIDGKSVATSSLRKDIAAELLDEGLLTVHANGSRRTFRAIRTSTLKNYLYSRFEEFRVINASAKLSDIEVSSRAQQAKASGNSKTVAVRSCHGFPLNCYEPIECRLVGKSILISPPEGSFMFIADWRSFTIPRDVIVVGIENMENFIEIRRQRYLFTDYTSTLCKSATSPRLLFVSRYPQSKDLRLWLQTIPNIYIHFGDFDLAGISIFLNEFRKYLGERATFLIPDDIEKRIESGSTKRYNDQCLNFKNLTSDIPCIQHLITLINTHHRCYDQEGYINSTE